MPLPASGPISFNNINVELGVAGTTQASLGQTSYRTLAGVASGQISMSNFYGKSNAFAFTISSNQTNANLRSLAVAAGWDGTSQPVATISAGVYIYSTSTSTPALTIDGSFPSGVALINNGLIYGMGGNAGNGGGNGATGGSGASGGNAVTALVAVSITNNGTISGGGGGGGGGGGARGNDGKFIIPVGGGGGGGGRVNASGAQGGQSGGTSGGTGTAATLTAAGSGAGGGAYAPYGYGGNGGNGGNNAASGGNGTSSYGSSGAFAAGGAGGAGGSAVNGNSNITWVATGTRYGAIS